MLSKSVTFLAFRFSQDGVATHCRRGGGNICVVYTENFLVNQLVKEFWKSIHICQTSSGFDKLICCGRMLGQWPIVTVHYSYWSTHTHINNIYNSPMNPALPLVLANIITDSTACRAPSHARPYFVYILPNTHLWTWNLARGPLFIGAEMWDYIHETVRIWNFAHKFAHEGE